MKRFLLTLAFIFVLTAMTFAETYSCKVQGVENSEDAKRFTETLRSIYPTIVCNFNATNNMFIIGEFINFDEALFKSQLSQKGYIIVSTTPIEHTETK